MVEILQPIRKGLTAQAIATKARAQGHNIIQIYDAESGAKRGECRVDIADGRRALRRRLQTAEDKGIELRFESTQRELTDSPPPRC